MQPLLRPTGPQLLSGSAGGAEGFSTLDAHGFDRLAEDPGCFALEDQAFLSPHVGDLDCAEARSFHLEVLDGLEDFLQAAPEMVVIDPHPDYPGARLPPHI